MMITINEIAELAGVSIGTVDRVIHNRKGVSKNTAELVNEIIEKYNFRPNTVAQAMQKFNSNINLAILTYRYSVMLYPDMYKGLLSAANFLQQKGYKCRIEIVEERTTKDMCASLEKLIGKNVNAVFTVLKDNDEFKSTVKKLNDNDIKVVSLNNRVEGAYYYYSLPEPTYTGRLTAETVNLIHKQGENVLFMYDKQDYYGVSFKDIIVDGYKECVNKNINTIYVNVVDEFDVYNATKKYITESDISAIVVMAPFALAAVLKVQKELGVIINTYTNDNSIYVRECLKKKQIACAFLYDAVKFTRGTIINSFKAIYPEIPFDAKESDFKSHVYLPIDME